MTKIVSYSVVHYGADYLPYALQSVLPFVEASGIFYTSKPSHGTQLNIPPIETKQQIIDCLPNNDKIDFVEASGFRHEGWHRDFAVDYMQQSYDPDYILVLDSDEVWPAETLGYVVEWLTSLHESERRSKWLLNFTHFYRSFNEVCRDNMWPIRVLDMKTKNNQPGYLSRDFGEIYHFGYAVTDKIQDYKWRCHGHIAEIRKNWRRDRWDNYQAGVTKDVHPTCGDNTWDPEPFDKFKLPDFMHLHSFFGLERIE